MIFEIVTSKQQQIDIQKFDISQTKTFRKMKNKKKTMSDRLQYNEQKIRAFSLTIEFSCAFSASAFLSSRSILRPLNGTWHRKINAFFGYNRLLFLGIDDRFIFPIIRIHQRLPASQHSNRSTRIRRMFSRLIPFRYRRTMETKMYSE